MLVTGPTRRRHGPAHRGRFGSYAIVMHAVAAFSSSLRQEVAGQGIQVSVIYPAVTATDLLKDAKEAEMPPAFRYITPDAG